MERNLPHNLLLELGFFSSLQFCFFYNGLFPSKPTIQTAHKIPTYGLEKVISFWKRELRILSKAYFVHLRTWLRSLCGLSLCAGWQPGQAPTKRHLDLWFNRTVTSSAQLKWSVAGEEGRPQSVHRLVGGRSATRLCVATLRDASDNRSDIGPADSFSLSVRSIFHQTVSTPSVLLCNVGC